MREKLIEVKRILGMCVKQGISSECKGCPYSKSKMSCVDALMEDALTVINHLERKDSVQKWIPVSERLPEVAITHNNRWEKSTESVHVLCYCKQKSGKRMVKEGSCKVYASGTIYWMIPGTIDSVTHWMPLPEPPKGE